MSEPIQVKMNQIPIASSQLTPVAIQSAKHPAQIQIRPPVSSQAGKTVTISKPQNSIQSTPIQVGRLNTTPIQVSRLNTGPIQVSQIQPSQHTQPKPIQGSQVPPTPTIQIKSRQARSETIHMSQNQPGKIQLITSK